MCSLQRAQTKPSRRSPSLVHTRTASLGLWPRTSTADKNSITRGFSSPYLGAGAGGRLTVAIGPPLPPGTGLIRAQALAHGPLFLTAGKAALRQEPEQFRSAHVPSAGHFPLSGHPASA